MRRTSIMIAVCMVAAMALTLYAQRDIMPVMKEVGPTNAQMGKNIGAGTWADVAKDAEKLQGLFKEAGEFMKAQKAAGAVTWANDAAKIAGDIAAAAKAGKAEDATAAAGKLKAQCKACHDVHREGTPGNFKFKAGGNK